MSKHSLTRRSFLKTSATGVTLTAPSRTSATSSIVSSFVRIPMLTFVLPWIVPAPHILGTWR